MLKIIVPYSWHLVVFVLLVMGINIDSFRYFGQHPPVLYISLHYCISLLIGPSSNAFSISAAIKSVPVALLVFYLLMACFISVDVIDGPLSSIISGLVTLSSA